MKFLKAYLLLVLFCLLSHGLISQNVVRKNHYQTGMNDGGTRKMDQSAVSSDDNGDSYVQFETYFSLLLKNEFTNSTPVKYDIKTPMCIGVKIHADAPTNMEDAWPGCVEFIYEDHHHHPNIDEDVVEDGQFINISDDTDEKPIGKVPMYQIFNTPQISNEDYDFIFDDQFTTLYFDPEATKNYNEEEKQTCWLTSAEDNENGVNLFRQFTYLDLHIEYGTHKKKDVYYLEFVLLKKIDSKTYEIYNFDTDFGIIPFDYEQTPASYHLEYSRVFFQVPLLKEQDKSYPYNSQHISNTQFTCSPNPLNESATISYSLLEADEIDINVLSIDGKLKKQIVQDAYHESGEHSINTDLADLLPGVYILSLTSDNTNQVLRIIKE